MSDQPDLHGVPHVIPGPWKAVKLPPNDGLPYWQIDQDVKGGGPGWKGIALVYISPGNANLIAAAPDLLAALKRALNADGGDWQNGVAWDKAARAAIEKAEGGL